MAANQNKPPFSNYNFPLKEGSLINGANDILDGSINGVQLANATLTNAQIAAATVTGANLTMKNNYVSIAVNVQGTTVANVFGGVAPTAGTITSFGVLSVGSTSGTVVLFGTTAGTIATVATSATGGTYTGSNSFIAAAVAAGDTVKITPTTGSMTCIVTFETAN